MSDFVQYRPELNVKVINPPPIAGTVAGIHDANFEALTDQVLDHTHTAADIASGIISPARLGTNTYNNTTFLRGDGVWVAPPVTPPGGGDTQIQFNNGGAFGGSSTFTRNSTTGVINITGNTGGGTVLNLTNSAGACFIAINSNSGNTAIIQQRDGAGAKGGFTGNNGFSVDIWGSSTPIAQFFNSGHVRIGAGSDDGTNTLQVPGSANVTGVAFSTFQTGAWINMPTTGPSGIGSGGAGINAWMGYTFSNSQWFSDSTAGDVCYRNTAGSLLWGTTADVPNQLKLSTSGFSISTPTTIRGSGSITDLLKIVSTGIADAGILYTSESSGKQWKVGLNIGGIGSDIYSLYSFTAGNNVWSITQTGNTVQAGSVTATSFSGNGASITSLNANNIASGTVPTARLGSGTANSGSWLKGNQTWAAITSADISDAAVSGTPNTVVKRDSGGSFSTSAIIANKLLINVASISPSASIAVDADSQQKITVSTALSANIAFQNPTGTPIDRQTLEFRWVQDGTGGRTIGWGNKYYFPTVNPQSAITTTANKYCYVIFQYNANLTVSAVTGIWVCMSIIPDVG